MKNKINHVFLLTEGSAKIGYGHVARCCALYDAFICRGFEPVLIVDGDDSIVPIIADRQYQLLSWKDNQDALLNMVQGVFCVVVDSYLADISVYEKIKSLTNCLISIDDFDRISYPKGIVVNSTVLAERFSFHSNSGAQYLLGTEYVPLRKPFWGSLIRRPSLKTKKEIKNILVTFGGDDRYNLTPQILELLKTINPQSIKRVIVALGYSNVEKIKSSVDSNTDLVFSPNANKMMELMCEADLAVSAAGTTLYELAACGTPTLMISVAENQKLNVEGWSSIGFSRFLGHATDKELSQNFMLNYDSVKGQSERERMRTLGWSKVDGQGVFRIVEEAIKFGESNFERA